MDDPLIIPLVVEVSKVFDYLVEKQILDPKLIIAGFPHPSGANPHRKKQFEANKESMKEMIRGHFQSKSISSS